MVDRLDNAATAAMIGIAVDTLNAWRCRRHGPAFYRIAGRIWYERADVLAWIEAQRVEPQKAIAA